MKSQRWCQDCLILVALLLAVGCGDDDDSSDPIGLQVVADTVWVDSISAVANSQVKIDITLRNSTGILGAEVPIRFTGTDLTIDSGSFAGGRFSDARLRQGSIDRATQTVFMIAGDTITLPSGKGLFASLYVTLGAAAAGQEIAIDSTFDLEGPGVFNMVSYVTPDFTQILPVFRPGKIVVAP